MVQTDGKMQKRKKIVEKLKSIFRLIDKANIKYTNKNMLTFFKQKIIYWKNRRAKSKRLQEAELEKLKISRSMLTPAMMMPPSLTALNPAAAAIYGAAVSRTHLPHLTPHLNIYGQTPSSGLDWTKISVWGRILSEFEIKILSKGLTSAPKWIYSRQMYFQYTRAWYMYSGNKVRSTYNQEW